MLSNSVTVYAHLKLTAFPIAQVKSLSVVPLRLRFLICILEKIFCVPGLVICRTIYWLPVNKQSDWPGIEQRQLFLYFS